MPFPLEGEGDAFEGTFDCSLAALAAGLDLDFDAGDISTWREQNQYREQQTDRANTCKWEEVNQDYHDKHSRLTIRSRIMFIKKNTGLRQAIYFYSCLTMLLDMNVLQQSQS